MRVIVALVVLVGVSAAPMISATSCSDGVKALVASRNGTLPEPRSCVAQAAALVESGKIVGCTAQKVSRQVVFACATVAQRSLILMVLAQYTLPFVSNQ